MVEREELPGGRAGVLRRDGFTFETGPTVLTMPDLIADAVRAASHGPAVNLHDLLPMRQLDPAYRACFADGSTINVRFGCEAMRDEIAQSCGSVDAAAFDSFVDWLRHLYHIEMPNFIEPLRVCRHGYRDAATTIGALRRHRAGALWADP